MLKVWQVEQLVTETMNRLRAELQKKDREREVYGAVLHLVISPEKKAAVEFKLIEAVTTDDAEATNDHRVAQAEVAPVRR